MNASTAFPKNAEQRETWPRLWRLFVVAVGTLILCACRGPMQTAENIAPPLGPAVPCPAPRDGLAQHPAADSAVQPCSYEACPQPACPQSCPSCPAAVQCPPGMMMDPALAASIPRRSDCRDWANDEFIADGGDFDPQVSVQPDWEVLGLTPEETVAHFDTLDGRTLIEPSNRVCIYAPRFCAVRLVEGVIQNEQSDVLGDVNKPVNLVRCDDIQEPLSSKQHVQPRRDSDVRPPLAFITKQGDGALSTAVGPKSFQDAFQPYENMEIMRSGVVNEAENAWLAKGVEAAIVWSDVQEVQVILDQVAAQTDVGVQDAQVTYTVDQPPANPKLRLVKIASTASAKPGDVIDFTLRFDNVGNQLIGNVTLLDNLTTRLEFVPDSAQCSLPAQFIVKKNSVGSDVLRWELKDPLEKSKGGVIRFKCRVR